jgi:aspartyl-tRNA(Asn)/glutamyl-tRNA(Gln) amidotransferase subunit C
MLLPVGRASPAGYSAGVARISIETVDQVAKLAHLTLTGDERALFARQLQEILAYAEAIQALDTSAVEPMSHAGTDSPLREDVVLPGLTREEALRPAPDAADGLFRVPRVIPG